MSVSPELLTLANYMAGEFDNQQQAAAEPAWYVHLHFWQRPVPLFTADSLTFFAEQANIVNLDQPYRSRILRLRHSKTAPDSLEVQYYRFKELAAFQGAGRNPERLKSLTPDDLEFLPGCILNIEQRQTAPDSSVFAAVPPPDTCCRFCYQGKTIQVSLGFEATAEEFRSYDKGINPDTGKAIWGALLGPYRFTKRHDFSTEIPV